MGGLGFGGEGIGSNFSFLFSFFRYENHTKQTEQPQMGRQILGYSVCLCPIKSLYGLRLNIWI